MSDYEMDELELEEQDFDQWEYDFDQWEYDEYKANPLAYLLDLAYGDLDWNGDFHDL